MHTGTLTIRHSPPSVRHLDLTLDTPAANLAADEALLDAAEAEESEAADGVLRFYESPVHFIVVGYGNRIAAEVDVAACAADGVPILRRVSGGGTVVLGPGCLAYALVLPVDLDPQLETVTGANRFIMERNRAALAALTGRPVAVQGHTDLAVANLKFSGNAQRRRRRTLLFHGTFLLHFDLACVGRWLRHPSAEPVYRNGRDHSAFVMNLGLSPAAVKTALGRAWEATVGYGQPIGEAVARLMRDRYSRPEWHARW